MRRRLLWVQLYQQTGDVGLVCRRCGISYPTLRKWVRRYREAGEAGFVSRSRRPAQSPNRRIFEGERALILNLRVDRKLGARRIQNELRRHHDLSLSLDSIHKVLVTSQVPPLVRLARRKTRHRYARVISGDRSSTPVRLPRGVISTPQSMTVHATECWPCSLDAPRPVRWPS
jgi:transposase-like protein